MLRRVLGLLSDREGTAGGAMGQGFHYGQRRAPGAMSPNAIASGALR